MKLKANHGALEIKGLGIRLTQDSTDAQIQKALDVAPHIAKFIDGAGKQPKKDIKDVK